MSSLKVETLVGGVTGWKVGRALGVGGGGGELVGDGVGGGVVGELGVT